MALTTTRFDAADYLDTPEMIAAYLDVSFEEAESAGDIAAALGVVARAKGMPAIAEKVGLTREGLYKALSADGNPTTETLLKVMWAFNLRLKPVAVPEHEAA